ncbi:MAG TPA: multicopper oxidase domain-containing protein, partial [Candidatus Eremiobacteraceae bacterium]|nr:multicopper oxidase domain-containing protein [Candidatus Eremiobacteraceae bacterium]
MIRGSERARVVASAAVVACALVFAAPARADSLAPSAADITNAEAQARADYALLPSLPPVAAGKDVTIRLIAEVKPWTPAPGVTVQAWTYNGTVPGPTIHVRQGTRVRIIFTNDLPEPTTIHWHGISLPADMDGVPGMSQPPVQPGQTFVYSFVVRDAGTYMYHTHVDDLNQLDKGLYGAFIVDPAKPTEHYDHDYLMLLSSWRVYSDAENYFSINGLSYPLTRPYVVAEGDHVRIREINISGTENHAMHIHGHHFQVVAIDGVDVPPALRQSMDTVALMPGEIRDIALIANAQPGTWMIHCHVADHMLNGDVGPGGLITALQYKEAPDKLTAMATADMMTPMTGGGGDEDEGGSGQGGPPLNQTTTIILGAIAGLTIFFGLPFAAMKKVSQKGIAFLNAVAIGVLFFLLFDVL